MAPVVAIVGSVDPARTDKLGLKDVEAAKGAGEALGRALFEAGCDLVVYSNKYIEGDVVRGYVASGSARPNSVVVRYPEDAAYDFPDSEVFDPRPDFSRAWEFSFYRSLFEVDGVVLVGGGQSTLVAGLIAISLEIPVVAVGAFGGRAREVRDALPRGSSDVTDADLEIMRRPWRAGAEKELVKSLLDQRDRRDARRAAARQAEATEAKHRRNSLIVAAVAFVAAIAGIVVVFETQPGTTASLVALFACPLLAGVSGAIVRTVMEDGTGWLKTTLLGLMAGAIASLLFVASQLATSPDALESKGVKTLAVFVVAVGFAAGLTFDAVFRKLREKDVVDAAALDRAK